MEIKRGQVLFIEWDSGLRPSVIVSNDICNKFSPVITAAPLSSKVGDNKMPIHIPISKEQYPALPIDSYVIADLAGARDKKRIKSKEPITFLSEEDMKKVDRALGIHLGLIEPTVS